MTQPSPIEPFRRRDEIDSTLRKQAVARLEARRAFQRHLGTYALMSTMFVLIWFFSGAGYFWPMWPMLGWGIGLAFHGLSLRDRQITEAEIIAEAAKLRGPQGPGGSEGPTGIQGQPGPYGPHGPSGPQDRI